MMLSMIRHLFLLSLACGLSLAQTANDTLVSQIYARTDIDADPESLSLFLEALQAVGILDSVLGNTTRTFTVFVPTNAAILASPMMQLYMTGLNETSNMEPPQPPRWHYNLLAALKQHILPDVTLNSLAIFDLQVTELKSMHDPIAVDQLNKHVQGAALTEIDVLASNGILHVINKVIQTKFYDESFAQIELQIELGPDKLGRVALTDVVDFVGGRETLNEIREEGTTFLGCRIRAFNKLEDYLPQTINHSPDGVIYGEFLNDTYKAETIENFIEYSMIPKNYYNEDIKDGFTELTVPVPKCGHMWVTKNQGHLCFNNGCVVETPDPREYIASNGVGYIVDKCQVCPGIAMLVDFAAEFTRYNLRDTAQFFRASEWNLRDLRQSVGDNTSVTLFASINTGWNYFNMEDVTRLAGDEWKPHQLDLLRHMLVQGLYTYDDLQAKFDTEGAFYLTSLANQTIKVDLNTTSNQLTSDGGELFFPDIQGVDGIVHLTTQLPLPRSVTRTIYDVAKEDPQFSTQIAYIDTVYLDEDMKRLLPLTALYAPNKEWEGKKTKMEEIAKNVLKSHMFEHLWWCDRLRKMAGTAVTSLNEKKWNITINENNFPCFDSLEQSEEGALKRACITKCDILARNGIVHELDTLLLFEAADTRPPSQFAGDFPTDSGGGTAPSPPTVYRRPTPSTINAPVVQPEASEQQSGAVSYSLVAVTTVILLSMLL